MSNGRAAARSLKPQYFLVFLWFIVISDSEWTFFFTECEKKRERGKKEQYRIGTNETQSKTQNQKKKKNRHESKFDFYERTK